MIKLYQKYMNEELRKKAIEKKLFGCQTIQAYKLKQRNHASTPYHICVLCKFLSDELGLDYDTLILEVCNNILN